MKKYTGLFARAAIASAIAISFAPTAFASNQPVPTQLAERANTGQAVSDNILKNKQVQVAPELLDVHSTNENNEQTIRFLFSGNTPAVKSFSLKNPGRLVIDFMGAANKTQKGAIEFQGKGAKNVEFVGNEQRLRSVIALHDNTEVVEQWNGNVYTVTLFRKNALENSDVANEKNFEKLEPSQKASLPSAAPLNQEILKVDFRKGKSVGSGRLSIDLSNSGTPIDIKTAKNGVIIDFVGTAAPSHLMKKFELADQMTPASSMEIKQLADRTRVILRAQGKWEQNAYQVENKFVFEIKPIYSQTVSKTTTEQGQFKGDKLTLNFQNIEVRTVLQVLSEFSNLNIITSDSVGGNITLRLKDVPWDQALDLIMQSRNLDSRRAGNVIWIAPQAEIRAKEKSDAEFRKEQSENKQMLTEAFQINYSMAAQITALLTNAQQRMLTKNGSAVFDERTNTIFVQDIPEKIDAIRSLIQKIDVPVSQVMIEAKIVEANESFGKSIGARLGYTDTSGGSSILGTGLRGQVGGQLEHTASTAGNAAGTNSFSGSQFVNLPTAGLNGKQPGLFSFILFNNSATRFLNLELSALVADGKGQVLSNPRVVTLDKQNAVIKQGTQIPFATRSNTGEVSTTFAEANLELNVTPQITPDGNVFMTLKISKNSVGNVTNSGPAIDTKEVNTKVLVENEGMVIIGGIFSQEDRINEEGVPMFSDLPYIGSLFRTRTNTSDRRELLVFVSPKIVLNHSAVSADNDESIEQGDLIRPIMMQDNMYNGKVLPGLTFKKP